MPGAASIDMDAETFPQEESMKVLIGLLCIFTVVLLMVRRLAKRDPYEVWLAKWERGKRAAVRGILRGPANDPLKGSYCFSSIHGQVKA
jgi:hypothetical protein